MASARSSEWFDNDRFWSELYPFIFHERVFADAPEQTAKILKLAEPKGGSVLDLACGPGRISIALARSGFSVTGVDRTPYLLNKARDSAKKADVSVEWVESDMRDFVRTATFDLVISLFTSFGYFENKEEDVDVLRNVLMSLRPGGAAFVDVLGKEVLAGMLQSVHMTDGPDGARLVRVHRIVDDWTRVQNEWILIRDARTTSFAFHHTIYSGQELRDRMERAGFVNVMLYGNFDGAPYDNRATRLIAVGRRAV